MAADSVRFEILRDINAGTFTWRLNDEGEILFTSAPLATVDLAIAGATAARATLVAAISPPGPDIVSIVQTSAVLEAATASIVNLSAGVMNPVDGPS
jgi:hypothetical protein